MAQFKAIAESLRYSRSGKGFEVTGSIKEVVGAATLDSKDSNAHLVPMAAEILANQMKGLEVGGKLAYNWACSVMNVIVERVA